MTRRDIRRGTALTMLFSVCVCIVISITLWRHSGAVQAQPSVKVSVSSGPVWSDTLTNASSAYAPLQPMDRELERFLEKWKIKGVSLAVTRNDSLLYAKGYGWADLEAGKPMEATTIMRMASASKLVTAIAVMKLCEDGKLSLQSRVFGPNGILNDNSYTEAMCDPRMLDITVDHLLLHQGGFGRGAGDPMFTTREIMAAKHLDTPPTPEELIRIVLGRRIAFTPGAGRIYSNFGYMVLSMVIERVTGRSYWDYVTDSVLRPAGCYGFRPATNYYAERSERETRYY
ncbi:MAG: beta-lactamase family protein, partial [Muribaculaceae bacterium]|nr:beta-lactamase family protein [Muribaculaceae bacterium]